MRTWRTFALVVAVAAAGAAGTAVVAAAFGMPKSDIVHLLWLILPAALVTVVAALFAAKPLLRRASLRQRFVAVALVAAAVALANVAVLTRQMFVSAHDATILAVLLVFALGAGVAAALVVARTASASLDRLDATARALGEGRLDARTGTLDAGPELDTLARTLDQMAERLQAAQLREREAESMRRDLITTVSHDLRTPLASLRAMIEAVDDGVVTDVPSLQRYAHEMRRSVDQLVTMVDDLFELTQLDAAAIETETRRARLEDIVRSAVAAVEGQAGEKGLSLVADLGDAGETACSPRLVRVLQNLLANAVRHTPADGSVRITAVRDDATVRLAVVDTGEGIAPSDLDRVFDPFFRADPARSGGGAGLGLALAKRIVEAMGGRISVESAPASGSRFAVELPL
jgi:signal transduction histidine kinase